MRGRGATAAASRRGATATAPALAARPSGGGAAPAGCVPCGSGRGQRGRRARGGFRAASTAARAAASSSPGAAIDVDAAPVAEAPAAPAAAAFELACPICMERVWKDAAAPGPGAVLECGRCRRSFPVNPAGFADLTLTSGAGAAWAYEENTKSMTTTFESPVVSFIYERGWRQNFALAGFPGPDKEFATTNQMLDAKCTAEGPVLDLSCGSGLFTRRFLQAQRFPKVVALDYSENMLKQTRTFIDEDAELKGSPDLMLVRGDASRLPFTNGAFAAVHAGAAIHCWPNPSLALAEISRVLKPGGVFVGTTFMYTAAPLEELLGEALSNPLIELEKATQSLPMRPWQEAELRNLTACVGLDDFTRERSQRFIQFSVRKPVV